MPRHGAQFVGVLSTADPAHHQRNGRAHRLHLLRGEFLQGEVGGRVHGAYCLFLAGVVKRLG